jgi:GNAT superfamily N-acetyltransferase
MTATVREIHPPDTALVFDAMRALRPHYDDEGAFVRRVDEVQRPEGYRLVAVFDPEVDERRAAAVAGFRLGHNLAWGKRHLYVDDLSTLPEGRRRGHGRRLLDWLADEARRAGCDEIHLDSAHGPARADAHRLYFNAGYQTTAHHFVRSV